MARVRYVERAEASEEVRKLYEGIEGRGAKVLNLFKTLANTRALRNFMRLGVSLLEHADLEAKLRELAILRVANLAGSEYEWTQHVPIALEAGVSKKQIEEIGEWQDSSAFDEREKAVLAYTEEIAQEVRVKDETFARLRQHLGEQEVVELTLSIGYWGMVARVLVPLQVELEEDTVASARDLLGRHR